MTNEERREAYEAMCLRKRAIHWKTGIIEQMIVDLEGPGPLATREQRMFAQSVTQAEYDRASAW